MLRLTAEALGASGLTERVRLCRPETAEHQQLFDELAASLTQLPLYRRAAALLDANGAAAVSLWWLAVAPVARRALPAELDAELAPWLERDGLPAPLAAEVELLRSQVEFLVDRAGGHAPAT